ATDALVYLAVSHGADERLALLAYALAATSVLPPAVQGLVNLRFPSGRLSSRAGRVLEIALIVGIVIAFIAGVLGDYTLTVILSDSTVEQVGNPITGGEGLGPDAAPPNLGAPVVILVAVNARLEVVRR